MYQTGLVFGKFYPLHNGHINLINQAAMQCRTLYVLLSYDKRNMEKDSEFMRIKPITLQDQLKWLSYTFKDVPHVKIMHLDEYKSNIPQYPDGWLLWSSVVKQRFERIAPIDVIFTADNSYSSKIGEYFPKAHQILIDPLRTEVPISSTLIREKGIYHYWEYLPAIVRRHFLLKVAVLGIESTGKTTLTKSLAKRYATSYVGEYGRDYVVNELGGNELALVPDDLIRIAHGHKVREYAEEKTANKILFIDTTALETQLYRIFYTHNSSKVIHEIAMNENYDLYLIQDSSGTDWVDDGVRLNGDRINRMSMERLFNNLVNLYLKDKPVVRLHGDYHDRYNQATSKINELMAKV